MTKVLALFLLGISSLAAEMQNHYILGTNGLNSAVKPSGTNMAEIYTFYDTHRINNQEGHKVKLVSSVTKLHVQYLQNVLSYFSSYPILGGYWGFQIDVPYMNLALDSVIFNQSFHVSSKLRLSDIYVEPFDVRWHWDRAYVFVAYGFFAPTGRYKPFSLKNSGLGDWGQMFTLALTYFFDAQQTVSGSCYATYEIHSKKKDIDFRAGSNFCLDWGVGKTFVETYTLGVVGYYERQTKKDKGHDVPKHFRNVLDKVYSIGPEIDIRLASMRGIISGRYEYELKSLSRTLGKTLTLTAAFNF